MVLTVDKEKYRIVLEAHVQVLDLLDSSTNGYRDIKTVITNLNGTSTTLWKFNGSKYEPAKKAFAPQQ